MATLNFSKVPSYILSRIHDAVSLRLDMVLDAPPPMLDGFEVVWAADIGSHSDRERFVSANESFELTPLGERMLNVLGIQKDFEFSKIPTFKDANEAESPLEETVIDTSANPSHYDNFDIAPVDLIDCYNLNFFEGNVVKYVSRARHKNGREDLLKALWYLLWALGFPKKKVIELVKQIEGDLGS